jgi:prolyl-tRNA synthetase
VVYWAGGKRPVSCIDDGANDELNEAKLTSVMGCEVRPIESEKLRELTGADGGSIGPVGLADRQAKGQPKFRILADKRLEGANGLVSGANKNDYHLANIDLTRDCVIEGYHDLRTIQAGETSPNGKSRLRIVRGIELGHIFKLGTKYSDAMHAGFLDEKGEEHPVIMGSYGIGIERIVACHIEQNHDENGIVWDRSLAPFDVHLMAATAKSNQVVEATENLYVALQEKGLEVLYDDRRDFSPGFKFKDADLLGMPLQIILGEKNLAAGKIELKVRKTGERQLVGASEVVEAVFSLLG